MVFYMLVCFVEYFFRGSFINVLLKYKFDKKFVNIKLRFIQVIVEYDDFFFINFINDWENVSFLENM